MPTETPTLRVVHKTKYDEQHFLTPSCDSLGPLGESSVRVQSAILGLSANNLAYCANGTVLHWWDTFPVPEFVEAPYNDRTQYGISPGWGYATIVQSNLNTLKTGSLLWGFFPISTFPVDLYLEPSPGVPSHYIERSEHRAKVMPLYQRYIAETDPLDKADPTLAAWKSMLLPPWKSAYMFNRFAFASMPGDPVLHPGIGHPWTPEDADLKDAIVICFGAGSKTSRSFVYQLAQDRAPGSGPLAVLQVSSVPGWPESLAGRQGRVHIKTATYAELHSQELLDWLLAQPVKKFVALDFAGRAGTCEALVTKLRANPAGTPVEVLIVGGESKVYTSEDLAQRLATTSRLDAVRCNASGIRESAIESIGEAKFFEAQDAAFKRVLQHQLGEGGARVFGIKLEIHKGLRGPDGMERGWERVCQGDVKGDEGLAFLFY